MGATARAFDFTDVKDGGGQFSKKRMPEGEYLAEIVKVEDAKAKDDIDQYLFTLRLKKHPTATYPFYCKLQPNQLWKLRTLMMAAGISVPKKRMKVDPNRAIGKLVGVLLEDGEYNGRKQSEVNRVFPAADLSEIPSDEAMPDDDEPTAEAEDDEELADVADEPEEEEDGDGLDSMSRNELKVILRELDSEAKVFKSTSDDDLRSQIRALRAKATSSSDDEELEDLDIDEL